MVKNRHITDKEVASVAMSGEYDDLKHKPTIPEMPEMPDFADVAMTGDYNDLANKPIIPDEVVMPDLAAVATSGSYADLINKPSIPEPFVMPTLSTVATTGDYSDLLGKPTIGSAASKNSIEFATSAQGAKADSALQSSDVFYISKSRRTAGKFVITTTTVSSGNAVFDLTDSSSNAIFTEVFLDSANITFTDSSNMYRHGVPVLSGDRKTLTVPITRQNVSLVSVVGINVLGAITWGAAPNGINVRLTIAGQ